jgi:hypothetical protein
VRELMGRIERKADKVLWEKFMNPEECIELDIIGAHEHEKYKNSL